MVEYKLHGKDFRTLFNSANDIIWVHSFNEKNPPGKIIAVNPIACEKLGYKKEELLALSPQDISEKVPYEKHKKILNDLITKRASKFDSVLISKDGKSIYVEVNAVMIDLEGSKAILATSRDITKRKEAEEALYESEERFRKIFEDSPLGIGITGLNLKLIRANPAWCNMLGYTEKELIKLSFPDITHPDDIEKDIENAKKLANMEIESYKTEKRYIKKNKEPIWVSITATIICDDMGEPLYYQSVIEDIAERKKSEEAIKREKEFSETIINSMNDSVSIIDVVDFKIISTNKVFLDELGLTEDEVLGKPCYEVTHKQSSRCHAPEHRCPLSETRVTGEYSSAEHVHYTSNGREITFDVSTSPIKNEIGEVVQVVHIARDVTERKLFEHSLKRDHDELEHLVEKRTKQLGLLLEINNAINSGALLEEVFNMATEGINKAFDFDACDIFILESNGESKEIIHASMDYDSNILKKIEKMTGLKSAGLRIPLFEGSNLKDIVDNKKHLLTEDVEKIFADFTDKKSLRALAGRVAKISKLKYVLRLPLIAEGNVLGVLGVATRQREIKPEDIINLDRFASQLSLVIKKKQMEQTLLESEERYRSLFENADDTIFTISLEGIITSLNPAFEIKTGRLIENWIGKPFSDIVHPDDLPLAMNIFQCLIKGEKAPTHELRILTETGEILIGEFKTAPQFVKGEIIGMLGIARDITKRKEEEYAIKRRMMKFKLEEGYLYLVKESSPSLSLEAFKDITKVGHEGVIFSRMNREDLVKRNVTDDFLFFWLSESRSKESQHPDLGELEVRIKELPNKCVVLIDRLDYLIFKNGFEKTLKFIQRLSEYVYLSRLFVILSIDPSTLSKLELKLLEKEVQEVKPLHEIRLPEDVVDILKFIYSQNSRGIKPTYTDIRKKMGISKPTVGKKIKLIISGEYARESKRGMYKVVSLTEKGRNLFIE